MSLLSRKSAKSSPAACAPRSKVLVALCALFTIAVPVAIICAFVLPHMGTDDANAVDNAPRPTLPPTTSATTPISALPTLPASPTTPVSGTAK